MADTLLDLLNRNTQKQTSAPAAGAGSTDTLAKLLAARSGRAPTPGGAPREENLLESAAVADTRRGLGDVARDAAPKVDAVKRAVADVSQQSAETQARLAEQSKRVSQQAALQAQTLIDRAYAERADLRSDQNRARAEQIGFLVRLSSDKYVDELQRIGEETRATTEIGFREAYREAELGGLFDLFGDRMLQEKMLAMDDAAFTEEMGKYTANWELFFESLKAKQANAQMQYSGYSDLLSGGIGGLGAMSTSGGSGDTTGEGTQEQKALIHKAKNNGGTLD